MLYRDYGLEVSKSDAMEYVWEVIGLMGATNILVSDVSEVKIIDYKGYLPADLYIMTGCREKSTKIPLLPSTKRYGVYKSGSNPTYNQVYATTINGTYVDISNFVSDIPTGFIEPASSSSSEDGNPYVYSVKNGVINVGLRSTTLEVAYFGFPTWEDNTPMIPEDQRILRGVVDFIAEKVAFKLMLFDKLSERKWRYIEDKSLWSKGSAINYTKLPTVDVMEGLRRQTIRIVPKQSVWENGFNSLNTY